MRRKVAVLCIVLMFASLFSGCLGDDQTPTTQPTTAQPTTVAPTTAAPTTAAPTTAAPTVEPTTAAPTTVKPTTKKPTTAKVTTAKPTTKKPTTKPNAVINYTPKRVITFESSAGSYQTGLRLTELYKIAAGKTVMVKGYYKIDSYTAEPNTDDCFYAFSSRTKSATAGWMAFADTYTVPNYSDWESIGFYNAYGKFSLADITFEENGIVLYDMATDAALVAGTYKFTLKTNDRFTRLSIWDVVGCEGTITFNDNVAATVTIGKVYGASTQPATYPTIPGNQNYVPKRVMSITGGGEVAQAMIMVTGSGTKMGIGHSVTVKGYFKIENYTEAPIGDKHSIYIGRQRLKSTETVEYVGNTDGWVPFEVHYLTSNWEHLEFGHNYTFGTLYLADITMVDGDGALLYEMASDLDLPAAKYGPDEEQQLIQNHGMWHFGMYNHGRPSTIRVEIGPAIAPSVPPFTHPPANPDAPELVPEKGKTLKILITGALAVDSKSWYNGVISQFKYQYPDVKVEVVSGAFTSWEEELVSAHSMGDPFDLIYLGSNSSAKYYNMGLLQPVTPYVNMQNPRLEINAMDACFKYGGNYYLATGECHFGMIYYNKDLIKANGLEDPLALYEQGQWTWDTFNQYVTKLTNKTEGYYGFASTEHTLFLGANAASVVKLDENGRFVLNLDAPATVKALEMIQNGWYTQKWLANTDEFRAGKIAMVGTWTPYEDGIGYNMWGNPINHGAVPLPAGPNNPNGLNLVYSNGWAIGAGADCAAHAGKLIDMLVDAQAVSQNEEYGIVPVEHVALYRQMRKKVFCLNVSDVAVDYGRQLIDEVIGGTAVSQAIEKYRPEYQRKIDEINPKV